MPKFRESRASSAILWPDSCEPASRCDVQSEEEKRRELEQQKRAEEAIQLRKDIQEEEKKLEQFNKWVDDWERAERLRRFIAVYAEKSHSWPAERQAEHKAWIEWAQEQADRVDPFVSQKPASVLDRKRELNWW